MKKKKKVLLILLSIIFFCIWYWWMYVLFWSNALDRISIAADLAKGGYYKPFHKVEELEWIGTDDDYMAYEFFQCMSIDYKQECIKDKVKAGIYITDSERDITLTGSITLKQEENVEVYLIMNMQYDRVKRKMIILPVYISAWEIIGDKEEGGYYYDKENIDQYMKQCNITEADIREYQNYILYDVVVKTWTKAHGGLNFLERLKIGLCIEDHTFDFEYQE